MKHTCHWTGCSVECPPAMWGCKKHWFMLPRFLRDEIWKTYRPGQEIRKDPSIEYIARAQFVQWWIQAFNETGRKLDEKEFCGPYLESLRARAESRAPTQPSRKGEKDE